MEKIKQFKKLCKNDDLSISSILGLKSFEEYYNDIASININNNIPEFIKDNFITVLHLLIYSVYYRPFNIIAKQHALITLESALRKKLSVKDGDKDKSLSTLLRCAVRNELINIEEINIPLTYPEQQKIQEKIGKSLAKNEDYNFKDSKKIYNDKIKLICNQRNQLTHKIQIEYIDGEVWVKICVDLVNQLYSDKSL